MLQACMKEPVIPTSLDSSAESVRLVSYFTDGDKDRKSVGDWILIDSGELLQVQRNSIHPSQSETTSKWTDEFLPLAQSRTFVGKSELRLDRVKGVVCLNGNCAFIYAICPSNVDISKENRCHVFRNQ